jgi:hypothetical protein
MKVMSAWADILACVIYLGIWLLLLIIILPDTYQDLWQRRALKKAGARTPRQHALLREIKDRHDPRAASPRPRAAAEERAWLLLQRNLSAEQARTLKDELSFTAQAQSGRMYRIFHDGVIYGISRQTNTPTDRFCLVPTTEVPRGDRLLALKLMIETNEQGFLRTAGRLRIG